MKQYFDTKEEAEEYRKKHELYTRSAEYLTSIGKWALVYPLKAKAQTVRGIL